MSSGSEKAMSLTKKLDRRPKRKTKRKNEDRSKTITLFKVVNWIIYLGIVPFLYSMLFKYEQSYLNTFQNLTTSIQIVAGDLEDYSSMYKAKSGGNKITFDNALMLKLSSDLDQLVSYHRDLGHLVTHSTYLHLHEFTYCYANKVLNAGSNVTSLKLLRPNKIEAWEDKLIYDVNQDKAKNAGILRAIENFYTRKQKLLYKPPDKSYGLCQ